LLVVVAVVQFLAATAPRERERQTADQDEKQEISV
jgi:hypothetical protein